MYNVPRCHNQKSLKKALGTALAIYSNMETQILELIQTASILTLATPFAALMCTAFLYVSLVIMPARELSKEKRLRQIALASDYLAKHRMYNQIGHHAKSQKFKAKAIEHLEQIELNYF